MLRLEMILRKTKLYFDTVKYLRPIQIIGQITKRGKLKRSYMSKGNIPVEVFPLSMFFDTLEGDEIYLRRFDVEAILRGEMELLHEQHHLNLNDWRVDASPLWRFNLHYFEYGIALALAYRKTGQRRFYGGFRSMVISWIQAHALQQGDAWHPYTISLRLPNWLIACEMFGAVFDDDATFKSQVFESLYKQYRTLLLRQETWNLGNHYLENLKASLLGSLLFQEKEVFVQHWKLWMQELEEQVLPDGFHFERSPMYHKIVLEDLLRVAAVLKQKDEEKYLAMKPYIQRMLNASFFLEHGCSRTLLFNDSGDNVARPLRLLCQTCWKALGLEPEPTTDLPDAGYYRLQSGQLLLVMDAGPIGAEYIPGHVHCDCLSFELFYQGKPLFVNMGTGLYQGELRRFFRSTEAHNTVRINGHEQSECWAEHRVAKRMVLEHVEYDAQCIQGTYRNYLGERHKRTVSLKDNRLCVADSAVANGDVTVESYLHIDPNFTLQDKTGYIHVYRGGQCIAAIKSLNCTYALGAHPYAPEFGRIEQSSVLIFRWHGTGNHGYIVEFAAL